MHGGTGERYKCLSLTVRELKHGVEEDGEVHHGPPPTVPLPVLLRVVRDIALHAKAGEEHLRADCEGQCRMK